MQLGFFLSNTSCSLHKLFAYAQITGVVVMLIFLPSVNFSDLYNPTQTSASLAFLYLISLLLFLNLLDKCLLKKLLLRITLIDKLLLSLLIFIVINRYLIQDCYGFSILFSELLGLSGLFFVLRSIQSNAAFHLFFLATILGGCIEALYGNLQLLGFYYSNSDFKISGNFFNPGPYAGYLASVFPVAIGFNILGYFGRKEGIYYWFYVTIPLVTIAAIGLTLPFTQSRAAWFGAIVSCGYIMNNKFRTTLNLKFHLRNMKAKIIAFSCTITIVFGLIVSSYFFKKDSSNGRLLIWKVTTHMIATKPLVGFGIDGFSANYMEYQMNYLKNNATASGRNLADNTIYAFNEPLQFVTENGTVAGLFLLILIYLFFTIKGKISRITYVAKAGLISILVFSCFSYPSQILSIKINAVVCLAALVNSMDFKSYRPRVKHEIITLLVKPAFLGMMSISLFFVYSYVRKLHQGYTIWKEASNLIYVDAAIAADRYRSCYEIYKYNGDFLMQYGKALALSGNYIQAVNILTYAETYGDNTTVESALGDSYKNLGCFTLAEIAYKKAWQMCPSRLYPQYLLAMLYKENNKNEKALSMAKKILSEHPKIESRAVEEIRSEMERILIKPK